jgi:hypothetical protein
MNVFIGFLNTVLMNLKDHRADIIVLMLTALHDKVCASASAQYMLILPMNFPLFKFCHVNRSNISWVN